MSNQKGGLTKIMKKPTGKKWGIIYVVLLLGAYFLYVPLTSSIADTTELAVNVSSKPQPSDIEIYGDYTTYPEAASLTPADEMVINFTITDADQLGNLNYVKIVLWDEAKGDWDSSANDTFLNTFYWQESTDTWNSTDDGSSTWAINAANCDDPGTDSSSTSYEFRLVFTPGKVAFEETTNLWKVNVTAEDSSSLVAWNATVQTGTWAGTCQWYGELAFTQGVTYGNFSNAVAGGDNVSIYNTNEGANTYLIYQVITNGVWDVQGSVTDWSGPETIDVDATPIEWINDDASWDDGFTQPINTTTSTFWDGSALSYNNTLEAGQNNNAYFRLAVPAGKAGGDYTQTLTITVING